MGPGERKKGRISAYLRAPVLLGLVFVLADILVFMLYWPAGLVVTGALVIYYIAVLLLRANSRALMTGELVSFATEYGQIQRHLLRELDLPYAILDESGRVVWVNDAFTRLTGRDKRFHKGIHTIFPSLNKSVLPTAESPDVALEIDHGEANYAVQMHRIEMTDSTEASELQGEAGFSGSLIAMYLYDETAVRIAIREVDDQSLVTGFIYMDNYEEALESVEDVRRSLLIALIDRKINKYIFSVDGICTKFEKDKYFIVLRKKALRTLRESHFELLSDVKTVNIGNEMAITISIGIGMDGLSYAQNYEFAKNAVDLALGRGGDQAVIRTPETTAYYGGKTQQVEKSTRVKARVKAQALKEIISTRDRVFIMGHRIADIDSFGSAIGIWRICRTLGKEAHIVLNDTTASLRPIVDLFRGDPEYGDDLLVTSQQAIERAGDNAALVVVDTNRPSITECPELLHLCRSTVVLDHHRQGTEKIEDATLSYIEAYASSACEMVSEILQYIGEDIRIRSEEADALYAGIVVDTNNFVSQTGVRTFEAAAFLRRSGADVVRVRKLFREDASDYKARADAVSQAEIYRGSFAISVCPGRGVQSPTVVGAQAANELLNIKGVRASFVLTEYKDRIYISARAIDEVNVQVIMEHLGGGGHMSVAGCQMENVTAAEAIGVLKRTLDQMIEEEEI